MIAARIQCRQGEFSVDLEMEIPRGVTALLGPSGAGKTTVLQVLLGLIPMEEGSVHCDGELLERAPGGPCRPPEARRFGMVYQDGLLFPHMTVEQNVRFGLHRAAARRADGEVDHWLEILELDELRRRRPAQLSGGERRRVAVARALVPGPRALFLDEPLSGLDGRLKRRMLLALRRLRRRLDLPVIYVTHDPGEVLAIADRVIYMEEGKVLWQGEPGRVLTHALGLGGEEPANFLEARVMGRDADGVVLDWHGLQLHGQQDEGEPGSLQTFMIRPSDLMLAVGEPGLLSARNRLVMRIKSLHAAGDRIWVELQAPEPLYAVVTQAAARELGLGSGKEVTVLCKRTAVRQLAG
jgi:molybdate transport system ATP-binding protein